MSDGNFEGSPPPPQGAKCRGPPQESLWLGISLRKDGFNQKEKKEPCVCVSYWRDNDKEMTASWHALLQRCCARPVAMETRSFHIKMLTVKSIIIIKKRFINANPLAWRCIKFQFCFSSSTGSLILHFMATLAGWDFLAFFLERAESIGWLGEEVYKLSKEYRDNQPPPQ